MSQRDRVAILGLGRSGYAVAKAAKGLGAEVVVYDEKPREQISKAELITEVEELGIQLELGWSGDFESAASRPNLLVANPAVPKTHPKLLAAVGAGVEVISEVEFAYRISRAPIIAITGTNGKSTSTVMTYLALKGAGVDAVLCGNIFGSGYPEQALTDAAFASTSEQVLVAEISSFQLEWVSKFRPKAAGITNIKPDHLDRYDGFDEYAATKLRIFANQHYGDTCVMNAENREAWALPTGPQVFTFGKSGEHARFDADTFTLLGQTFARDSFPFTEDHNFENAGLAALLAYGTRHGQGGVEGIMEGLRTFRGLAHRMEWVGERNGVRVINNSMCTNPEAVIKSTESLSTAAHPVKAHLLVGGVNKGLDFDPLARYLATQRHQVYLFGQAAKDLGRILPHSAVFESMEEAFASATARAEADEVIVLSPGCASTDQFRDFRDRGDVFKKIAKEWLTV